MLENDFKGLTFQNQDPSGPRITGEYILKNTFYVTTGRTKWENVLILFAMTFAYRLLFYVLIRASESLIPRARAAILMKLSTALSHYSEGEENAAL